MRKVITILTLCLCLAFSACGCKSATHEPADMLSPPKLSGALEPIEEALKKSITGDYTLMYPTIGEYSSAVIKRSLSKNGKSIALAFYKTVDGNETFMHLNVITKKGDEWQSVADQKVYAGGVNRVDFCDLDGDGVCEILVGWEVYGTSEMRLSVYKFNNKKLTEEMNERYSYFLCSDLNEDSKNEILIINFNKVEGTNYAGLYELGKDGPAEIGGCGLDPTVKAVSQPVLSKLSNNKPAVYVEETKGAGAVTEVLFWEKGVLVNPLLDTVTNETSRTLHSSATYCRDINGDNIIEIPIREVLPSFGKTSEEILYYTNWCKYNGESLLSIDTMLINFVDGYYIDVPEKWYGNISATKNSDSGLREFYRYDAQNDVSGRKLVAIKTFNAKKWDKGDYKNLDYTLLCRNGETVIVGWVCATDDPLAVNIEELKSYIKIIE